MSELNNATTLCLLGCGSLGTAILTSLLAAPASDADALPFTRFVACVRSEQSEQALAQRFAQHAARLRVSRNANAAALHEADVVILAADPADVETALAAPGTRAALAGKLLISVAAGWPRPRLEAALYGSASTARSQRDEQRAVVVRTLPNMAALAAQSLTAIETSGEPPLPAAHLSFTERIFARIGRTVRVEARHMDATTAVAGSTPAFLAVICDALVDAAVAVGMPRALAGAMVFQAMAGTAAMLQGGVHPGVLKDQGTSPEGCTMGGLMVLEEEGVRGALGKALREAVTVARLMGTVEHVNDTRR